MGGKRFVSVGAGILNCSWCHDASGSLEVFGRRRVDGGAKGETERTACRSGRLSEHTCPSLALGRDTMLACGWARVVVGLRYWHAGGHALLLV